MATKDPQYNAWELITLLGSKAQIISGYLARVLDPREIAVNDMGSEIRRMGELHLALKEAIAAMPKPIQVANSPEAASRRN